MAATLMQVRAATSRDLPRILEIYNREVLVSTATYDTEPRTEAEHLRWFSLHGADFPVLVAEGEGVLTGWASLSPWSDRAAYSRCVEVSVYVAEECRRRGIGRLLLGSLIDEARSRGFRALLARISAENEASILLHASQGFFVAGTLREVGVKFGMTLDVCIMEMLV